MKVTKHTRLNLLTAAVAAVGMGMTILPVQGYTGTWTNTAIGTTPWTTATNWSTNPSYPSVGGSTTDALTFFSDTATAMPATGTMGITNDLSGTYILNSLTLNGKANTSGNTINFTGGTLQFDGTSPTVNLNGLKNTGVLNYNIANNIILNTNTLFTGVGTGAFNFNGNISGAGKLTTNGAMTFSGSSYSYDGGTSLTGASGGGAAVLQTNNIAATTAFGTNAAISLNNATLGLGTVGTGLTAGQSMNVTGYNVTFQGQSNIQLKVSSGTSVAFTANSLVQGSAGSVLLINPTSGTTLGTTEKFLVTNSNSAGNVSLTPVNGMIGPSIIDGTNKTFLTYDATKGFVDATTTTTFGANNIVGITTNGQGTQSAYALRTTTNMVAGDNFTIGAGGFIGASGLNNAVGTLNFGSTPASIGLFGGGNYGTAINATAGATFYGSGVIFTQSNINISGGLTFASGSWTMQPQPAGGDAFQMVNPNPMTLLRGASINNAQSSRLTVASIAGDGAILSTNSSSNFQITINGLASTGTTTFDGTIVQGAGTISLIKNGLNTQILSGANAYSAGTTINGGTIKLTGAGTLGTGNITAIAGTTITLDSTTANADRIADSATLSLGGKLNLVGNSSSTTSESIGALTLTAGAVGITLTPGTDKSALLTFASLARNNGNTTLYRGTGLGLALGANTSNVKLTTAPTVSTSGVLAATDGVGTLNGTSAAVLRGALYDSSLTGNGAGFATYDSNGVRLLNSSTEQVAVADAAAYSATSTGNNVLVSNTDLTLTATNPGQTSNTLQLHNTNGGAMMTVTNFGTALNPQNGLLFSGDSPITLTGGTVTMPAAAAADLVVLSTNSSTAGVTINTTLTQGAASGAGVTVGGSGNIYLGNGSGATIILGSSTSGASGTLQINNPGVTTLATRVAAGTQSGTTQTTINTNINAGTLKLVSGGSLGSLTAYNSNNTGTTLKLFVASGATFDLNNIPSTIGNLEGYGLVINSNTAMTQLKIMGEPSNKTSSGNSIFAGQITGSLSVYIGGGGTGQTIGQTFSGVNTYTGGTTLAQNAVGYTFSINNPYAIGTGTFTIGAGNTARIDNSSGIAITLANNNPLILNSGFIYVGTNAFNFGTGDITLGATPTITVNGNYLTLAGVITGTNATYGLTKAGAGTLILTNTANLYTGVTTITGGTLTVPTLANGGAVSSMGQSTSDAANLVINGGTLQYTGAAASIDRQFTLGASGGSLNASGTGPLNFANNAAVTLSGSGARTFTFTGTNTGDNTLAAVLGDGTGGATSVTKAGTGTWVLSGTNTYTGPITINGGLLRTNVPSSGNVIRLMNGTLEASTDITRTLGVTGVEFGAGSTVGLSAKGGAVTINVGDLVWGQQIAGTTGKTVNIPAYGPTVITVNDATGLVVGMPISAGWINSGTYITAINGTNITLSQAAAYDYGAHNGGGATFSYFNPTSLVLNSTTADSALTFQSNLDLNGATRTINVGNAVASITGLVSNSSGTVAGLTKTGAGVLALTNTNTYNGVTTISGGTLSVATLADGGVACGLGSASNAAANLVINGGTLKYTGAQASTDRKFTIGDNNATLDASGTGALTMNGTASAYVTANQPRTLTLTGTSTAANTLTTPITNNGTGVTSVVKNGTGTWVMSTSSTYTGGTTVSGGVLRTTNETAFGTGAVNLNGGTVAVAVQTGVSGAPGLFEGRVANVGSASINLVAANPNTSVQLTTRYANTAYTSAAASGGVWADYSTYVYSGYLNIASTKQYTFAKNFDDAVSLVIDGQTVINNTVWNTPTKGSLTLSAGYHSFELRLGQGASNIGPNSANGWLATLGFGWDTQGRDNVAQSNFAAMTDPGDGSLFISAMHTGTFANNVNVTADSGLDITSSAFATTSFGNLTMGANTLTVTANAGQNLKFTATTLTGNATFNVIGGNVNTGSISGSFGLTKTGSGILTLASANTYTGGTTVNAGTLQLGTASALGTGGVTLNGGTLDLNAQTITLPSLAGAGGIITDNSANAGTTVLTVTQSTDGVLTSTITNGTAKTLALVKDGTGSLKLTAGNTYTGGTTVKAGTLEVAALSGSQTLTGGTLKVTAGANAHDLVTLASSNLTLGAGKLDLTNHDLLLTGGLGREVAVNEALVAPLTRADGSTVTTGVLTYQQYADLHGGSYAGLTSNDLLLGYTYAGDANLDGAITMDDYLQIDTGYLFNQKGWAYGDFNHDGSVDASDYALIDNNLSKQGQTPLAEEMIQMHAAWFGAEYTQALESLQAVPEPASLALLAVGALGLLSRRKR